MWSTLPDHIVLKILVNGDLKDWLNWEGISRQFYDLIGELWSRKRNVVWPYDILNLVGWENYEVSSYLDKRKLDRELGILVRHARNAEKFHFAQYRRLQVVVQDDVFENFLKLKSYLLQLKEVHFGKNYVTGRECFEALSRIFPHITCLRIEQLYPLKHHVQSTTYGYLKARIPNLEPGIFDLLDDNSKIVEDIRLLLELFENICTIQLKDWTFTVVKV